MTDVIQLVAALFVLFGAFFCLSAAVGVVRFPDVITRLHAATKPQVFGLILILTGVALKMWDWKVTLLGTLIVAFQILTAPVSAHMVARTAYRLGLWDSDHALVDELGEDLEEAGFSHPQDEDEGASARQGYRWKPAATWLPPTKPKPSPSSEPVKGADTQADTVVHDEQQAAAEQAGTSNGNTGGDEAENSWDETDGD